MLNEMFFMKNKKTKSVYDKIKIKYFKSNIKHIIK